jgi:hypothetical protein
MKKSHERLISLKFYDYRYRAKKRRLRFELTKEQFEKLVTQECSYCETLPGINFNGVDRVDSNLGYVFSNCVSACKVCNRWKSDMALKQFVMFVKAIYEKSVKKKE